jgi:hypothetical protein
MTQDRTRWRVGRDFEEPERTTADQFLFDLSQAVGDDIERYGVFMGYEGVKHVQHSDNVPGSLVEFTKSAMKSIENDFGPFEFIDMDELAKEMERGGPVDPALLHAPEQSLIEGVSLEDPIGVTLFSWGHPRWGQSMNSVIVYAAIVLQQPAEFDPNVARRLPAVAPPGTSMGASPVPMMPPESPPWRPLLGTVLVEAELFYDLPRRIVNAMRVLDVPYGVRDDMVEDIGRWIAGAGV